MTNNILLEIKNLHSGYGHVPVLHGVNLKIQENHIVGMLGHNGMGKTTLLKTLMGFLPAQQGQISFNGENITKLAPFDRAKLGIGYVQQGRGIFPNLTVAENLSYAYRGYSDDSEEQIIEKILNYFPRIKRLMNRNGGTLSGGEQQLLALARTMVGEPYFLILDEPTEGIQPSIIEEMSDTLNLIRKKEGLTILLVEQNFDFIMDLSDHVFILERGTIVGDIAKQDLQSSTELDHFLGLGAARQTRAKAINSSSKTSNPASSSHQKNTAPLTIKEAYMSIRRPTLNQMKSIISDFNMSMEDTEIIEYMSLMEGNFEAYDIIDSLADFIPEVKYPRTPGYKPELAENPLNAWYQKTDIPGANAGLLKGHKVILKDNICLAGVPMMNGSSTLEGYIPDLDATVATRILDAGGNIAGKAHCEYFCMSGGSHTNAAAPVHNPYKMGYSAGGSSSGCGALVGAGEIEMAIGGDQGGSIRIPASFCGAYGMKPTHGLVPYSGVMPIEPTIDHVGPITTSVANNALLLEVIAGEDGLDPRQYSPKVAKYTDALHQSIHGLRIGILTEGFYHPNSEASVDIKVLQAAEKFRGLGAIVEDVSLPEHLTAVAIWTPITLEGLVNTMMRGNGFGTSWEGLYVTSLNDYHANWRNRADELSKTLKLSMFVGEYMQKHYRGHYHAKAQNLSRKLKQDYNNLFEKYDLLLMPTTPMTAQPIPAQDAPLAEIIERAFEMIGNTAPFDATGHPAMSIPCGMNNGLPIGLQLVGKHYDEFTIYKAAHAFEQSGNWHNM